MLLASLLHGTYMTFLLSKRNSNVKATIIVTLLIINEGAFHKLLDERPVVCFHCQCACVCNPQLCDQCPPSSLYVVEALEGEESQMFSIQRALLCKSAYFEFTNYLLYKVFLRSIVCCISLFGLFQRVFHFMVRLGIYFFSPVLRGLSQLRNGVFFGSSQPFVYTLCKRARSPFGGIFLYIVLHFYFHKKKEKRTLCLIKKLYFDVYFRYQRK